MASESSFSCAAQLVDFILPHALRASNHDFLLGHCPGAVRITCRRLPGHPADNIESQPEWATTPPKGFRSKSLSYELTFEHINQLQNAIAELRESVAVHFRAGERIERARTEVDGVRLLSAQGALRPSPNKVGCAGTSDAAAERACGRPGKERLIKPGR